MLVVHSHSSGSTSSQAGNTNVICQICGEMGHPVLKCWQKFNNNYQHEDMPLALAAMRITDFTEQ